MNTYSRNIRTSATGSGVAAAELIAGSVGFRLMEVGICIVNATASVFALGRPAAIGITPTTPVNLVPHNSASAPSAKASLAVAWGTGPTLPAAFFRSVGLSATAGASLNPSWKFDNGIWVPPAGTIIIWTLSTVSIADIYFSISE